MFLCKSHPLPLSSLGVTVQSRSSPVRVAATSPEGRQHTSPPDDPDGEQPSNAPQKTAAAATTPRVSPQLSRWSRARALRSGRRLDRRPAGDSSSRRSPASAAFISGLSAAASTAVAAEEREDDGSSEDEELGGTGKAIYMVSDGTGWTAEHSVNAALGQFEHCLVDRGCPVSTHLFSGIDDLNRLMEIISKAAKEGALLLYTLADPSLAESAKKACRLWGVPYTDILGPTTEAIAAHLGVAPLGIPRGAANRQIPLSEDYFKRIEAIDFTIKQDDGALPQNLNRADIVLLGVSRTGKTPLSIYLAQKGYKVANVPIVLGVELPKTVFEINQSKIYSLIINPVVLQTIRRTRAKSLGFTSSMSSHYSDMDHVREELEFASKIFAQNPLWPVIEVTGKAIEETAAVIVRIHHDRSQRYTMPRISRRY
ncbi:unnamed protein product [Spirodela intermedia]|uniref:Uncharacterized protein n=1 Tax=Spirodela intermedia TaxID=51605 RepID=A0A7I8L6X3_SPIIN|nr:unnamed protein product [Spirodela intermedia]